MTAGLATLHNTTLHYERAYRQSCHTARTRARTRTMQASTGVGIDVVVDESTAMAVFRWARPGRARAAGALVSRRACVEHGAGQTLKGFFFSSRSCLSFSVCLSPGCTNLRERLRRWLCDAGGQWVHGCMGAWGERQSDAASVARRAACRDGLAACRFLEDGSPWLPACAWRPTPTHSPLPQHQYRRALPRKLTILYASNSDCCWPGWLAASPLACPQRG
ncbi:hypothetical protein GGP41_003809 [Bipolaris sorokiniana]|uniref:Uncharacterized protein n=1 Tax=Cochliobolus sativus TaxID=45130 RepID=A0A8H5ZDU8_COCSA|nr:hypothetical protein GGP41_003809 [Bipolaris sorokiniana]